MSIEALLWASNLDDDWPAAERLSMVEKAVLKTLALALNDKTGQCNPSHSTVAKANGMCVSSVKNGVRGLTSKNIISVKHHYDPRTKVYKGVSYTIHYKRHKRGVGHQIPQAPDTSGMGYLRHGIPQAPDAPNRKEIHNTKEKLKTAPAPARVIDTSPNGTSQNYALSANIASQFTGEVGESPGKLSIAVTQRCIDELHSGRARIDLEAALRSHWLRWCAIRDKWPNITDEIFFRDHFNEISSLEEAAKKKHTQLPAAAQRKPPARTTQRQNVTPIHLRVGAREHRDITAADHDDDPRAKRIIEDLKLGKNLPWEDFKYYREFQERKVEEIAVEEKRKRHESVH